MDIKELKSVLKLLKVGASKEKIPFYQSYLSSDKGRLKTCNNEVYISLDKFLDFKGDTNIYVLDSIINKIDDEFELTQVNDTTLKIISGNFESELVIEEAGFPEKEKPNVPLSIVTEDFLQLAKLAFKFTGVHIGQHVYVGNEFLCAYTGEQVFFAYHDLNIETPVLISRNVFQTLAPGTSIGITEYNTVVDYGFGYGIFTSDLITQYPIDKLTEFMDASTSNLIDIVVAEDLKKAVDKVSTVFHGERKSVASFINAENNLRIEAESVINGRSQIDIDSMSDTEFNISFDLSFLKNVPDDFMICVNPDMLNRLIAVKNETDTTIVMMGVA